MSCSCVSSTNFLPRSSPPALHKVTPNFTSSSLSCSQTSHPSLFLSLYPAQIPTAILQIPLSPCAPRHQPKFIPKPTLIPSPSLQTSYPTCSWLPSKPQSSQISLPKPTAQLLSQIPFSLPALSSSLLSRAAPNLDFPNKKPPHSILPLSHPLPHSSPSSSPFLTQKMGKMSQEGLVDMIAWEEILEM